MAAIQNGRIVTSARHPPRAISLYASFSAIELLENGTITPKHSINSTGALVIVVGIFSPLFLRSSGQPLPADRLNDLSPHLYLPSLLRCSFDRPAPPSFRRSRWSLEARSFCPDGENILDHTIKVYQILKYLCFSAASSACFFVLAMETLFQSAQAGGSDRTHDEGISGYFCKAFMRSFCQRGDPAMTPTVRFARPDLDLKSI